MKQPFLRLGKGKFFRVICFPVNSHFQSYYDLRNNRRIEKNDAHYVVKTVSYKTSDSHDLARGQKNASIYKSREREKKRTLPAASANVHCRPRPRTLPLARLYTFPQSQDHLSRSSFPPTYVLHPWRVRTPCLVPTHTTPARTHIIPYAHEVHHSRARKTSKRTYTVLPSYARTQTVPKIHTMLTYTVGCVRAYTVLCMLVHFSPISLTPFPAPRFPPLMNFTHRTHVHCARCPRTTPSRALVTSPAPKKFTIGTHVNHLRATHTILRAHANRAWRVREWFMARTQTVPDANENHLSRTRKPCLARIKPLFTRTYTYKRTNKYVMYPIHRAHVNRPLRARVRSSAQTPTVPSAHT